LEQQGQIYKVEGVDENATTTAAQDNKDKKRKMGKNGDDVSIQTPCTGG
jgi:hypothetical protein